MPNPISVPSLSAGNVVSAGVSLYKARFDTYLGFLWQGVFCLLMPWRRGGSSAASSYFNLPTRLTFNDLIHREESIQEAREKLRARHKIYQRSKQWFGLIVFSVMAVAYILTCLSLFAVVWAVQISDGEFTGLVGVLLLMTLLVFVGYILALMFVVGRAAMMDVVISTDDAIATGKAALARSWRLTRRHSWRASSVMFLAGTLNWPIISLILICDGLAIGFLLDSYVWLVLSQVVTVSLGIAASVIALPFWQVVKTLLYFDLLSREEGLDLRLRSPEAS